MRWKMKDEKREMGDRRNDQHSEADLSRLFLIDFDVEKLLICLPRLSCIVFACSLLWLLGHLTPECGLP